MFMDTSEPGGPGGEPQGPHCHSCKGFIEPQHGATEVNFEHTDDERLLLLNGIYHRQCAAPILSVKRAYDMMRGFTRGF